MDVDATPGPRWPPARGRRRRRRRARRAARRTAARRPAGALQLDEFDHINSTIIKPDIDEIIFCVAVVIDRIEQGEQMGVEIRQHYFSEENNPLYADPVPQQEKKAKREIPTEETIFHDPLVRAIRRRAIRRRAISAAAQLSARAIR